MKELHRKRREQQPDIEEDDIIEEPVERPVRPKRAPDRSIDKIVENPKRPPRVVKEPEPEPEKKEEKAKEVGDYVIIAVNNKKKPWSLGKILKIGKKITIQFWGSNKGTQNAVNYGGYIDKKDDRAYWGKPKSEEDKPWTEEVIDDAVRVWFPKLNKGKIPNDVLVDIRNDEVIRIEEVRAV